MTIEIYRVNVPDDAVMTRDNNAAHEQASNSVLGGSRTVKRTSSSPGDLAVRAQFRGRYAELMAREFRELVENATAAMPVSKAGSDSSINGYYTPVEDSSVMPDPRSDGIWEVRTDLARTGTRGRSLVAAAATPSDGLTNPYGSTQEVRVGLPAGARDVLAVDSMTTPTSREAPEPVSTVQCKHGAVDLYNPGDVSPDDPIYLYDLPYDDQGDVDPGIWDTRGEADITDADGVVSWQRVFDEGHDFPDGAAAVLENGSLRISLARGEEPTAERWDGGAGEWSPVALPSGGWTARTVDVHAIGPTSCSAQVTFEGPSGGIRRLDVHLLRGWDDALITIPPSESGPVPPALYDRLEPIASTRVVDPGVEQTLVERQEVR